MADGRYNKYPWPVDSRTTMACLSVSGDEVVVGAQQRGYRESVSEGFE
jgi:hypothetical protein